MESPGIGSTQAIVLEDSSTLKFSDVASFVALMVCLTEALAFLKISSGSETGVACGPLGFSLVLGLLESTLYQWSHQIDDYNRNNVQALSIIKAVIYVISQGNWASISSPRQWRHFVITPGNSYRLYLEDAW